MQNEKYYDHEVCTERRAQHLPLTANESLALVCVQLVNSHLHPLGVNVVFRHHLFVDFIGDSHYELFPVFASISELDGTSDAILLVAYTS